MVQLHVKKQSPQNPHSNSVSELQIRRKGEKIFCSSECGLAYVQVCKPSFSSAGICPQSISCVFEVKHLGLQVKPAGQDASLSQGLTNNPSLLMMRGKP